jgi:hypothetical protein
MERKQPSTRPSVYFGRLVAPQFGFFLGKQSPNHLPLGFVLLVLKKPTKVFDVEVCHHFFKGGNT